MIFLAIKIFVDQGHNPSGHNTGAENSGVYEQDITYNVGMYLAEMLKGNPEFEVRVSRPTPERSLARPMPPVSWSGSLWPMNGRRIILSASTPIPT